VAADPVEVIDIGPDLELSEDLRVALIDRLTTEKGALWYDEGYGTDIRRYVGAAINVRVVENGIEQECLADERVSDARAEVTLRDDGSFGVRLAVESTDGDLELDLDVGQVSARILGVEGIGD
jgi:hypothetical protein